MSSSKKASLLSVKRRSRLFLMGASVILLLTSLLWAFLSARLQATNADQLIDGYLFESSDVFKHATFPGAHTYLIKWPLFALAGILGNASWAVTVLTVLCALIPVAALAVLLWCIERRPAVLGIWYLVLSVTLLLVPAQPAPGTLLPVNFAMFTTRNLEYAVFLVVLVLLTRTRSWRDWSGWVAAGLAALLFASDGLFLPLLLGAIGLAVVLQFKRLRQAAWWLAAAFVGYIVAFCATKGLQAWQVTGFTNHGGASPYGLSSGFSSLAQAVVYAGLGVATLFGANPAYDHLSLTGWSAALRDNLSGFAAVAYGMNALIFVVLLGLTAWFVLTYHLRSGRAALLAIMSVGAALAATAIFVLTDHYYPVDSRYLAIWFFALPLCGAVALRAVRLTRRTLVPVAALLLLALPFAVYTSLTQYTHLRDGLTAPRALQTAVAQEVDRNNIVTLVGDYWDVTPARQLARSKPTIIPMSSCTQPQEFLSSSLWRQIKPNGAVAYLINSQPLPTGFQHCDPAEVEDYFGKPTRAIPIHTEGQAISWLYIYEDGMKHLMTRPARLHPSAYCPTGSVLNVVAHEDDDLLFLNPDLQYAIDAEQCITTVFVTAGDAGGSESYSSGRKSGSEAAYSYMYNLPNVWQSQRVMVNGKSITVATMAGAPRLQLIFLNLPDGNLTGTGFQSRENASLARLRFGTIAKIRPIEGPGTYNRDELQSMLLTLMNTYRPTEVRTQDYNHDVRDGDHSDHHAAGYFTSEAFKHYHQKALLKSYAGYPVRELPVNVTGSVLAAKEGAFFAYAGFDRAVCDSVLMCYDTTVYGRYLPRQYSRVVDRSKPLPHQTKQAAKPAPVRRECVVGGTLQVIDCRWRPDSQLAY